GTNVDLNFKGKSALITGASKGIGLATAHSFAQEGISVLHLAARSAEGLQAAKDDLSAKHGIRVEIYPTDLSNTQNVLELAAKCSDVDILVNNAADSTPGPIDQLTDQDWRDSLDMKIFSYVALTRELYAQMKKRGAG